MAIARNIRQSLIKRCLKGFPRESHLADLPRLWVTDNQGDWLGTSKLFHVKQDAFHGHPASLAWTDTWQKGRNPLKVPPAEFDAKRTRAAILFPQGSMANSPTQPITDTTRGKFGPFAGQLLVGEMNKARIMRVLVDEVAGETQGACLPFIDNGGLHRGMHRFVFAPDGSLWVGQTHLSWAGGSGLQRITWTGKTPMSLSRMKLTRTGFQLTFTKPLAKVAAENFAFQRYYYKYHQGYGSPQLGRELVMVTALKLSDNGKSVSIDLAKLNPGYIYQLDLKNITATDKTLLLNTFICYTLNRLTNGNNTAPHLIAGSPKRPSAPPRPKVATPVALTKSPQTFEAEDAGRNGPSVAKNNGGFTGKGFIDFQGPSGESLKWLIQTKTAGECTLSFRYALAGGNRPLQLKINGKVIAKALPFSSTGGWTTWKTLTATGSLKAGTNDIRLESTGSSGPNIDNLTIERN